MFPGTRLPLINAAKTGEQLVLNFTISHKERNTSALYRALENGPVQPWRLTLVKERLLMMITEILPAKKSKRSNLFKLVSSSDASFLRQEEEAEQAVPDEQTWVFDIETDQSCEQTNVHKRVLLIAKSFSGVQESFVGYNSVNDFCLWLFDNKERVRKCEWVIAHFGSGYDIMPILEWLYQKQSFIPKIVLRGKNVVSPKVGNKRFTDSYLFIPIPLRKFSKTFTIEETEKDYFTLFLTSSAAFEGKTHFHTISSCPNERNAA